VIQLRTRIEGAAEVVEGDLIVEADIFAKVDVFDVEGEAEAGHFPLEAGGEVAIRGSIANAVAVDEYEFHRGSGWQRGGGERAGCGVKWLKLG